MLSNTSGDVRDLGATEGSPMADMTSIHNSAQGVKVQLLTMVVRAPQDTGQTATNCAQLQASRRNIAKSKRDTILDDRDKVWRRFTRRARDPLRPTTASYRHCGGRKSHIGQLTALGLASGHEGAQSR